MPSRTLQAELKQSRPFASAEEEAFLNLLRTHGELLGPAAALLKGHGLSHAQYNILRILRGAGDGGLPCLEVAARMVTREPDITRLLDRLEDAGWVRRTRSDADRRVVFARITPAGSKLLASLDDPVAKTVRGLLGHLTRAELRTFSKLLTKARLRPENQGA